MESIDQINLFCPQCGCNLRGVPDGHCPQCGREFSREQLNRELMTLSLSTGKLLLRLLLVPALCVIAGAICVQVANQATEKNMAILFVMGLIGFVGLLIPAIFISRRLARHLSMMRSLRLGAEQSGLKDRKFIRLCTLGLFCCQGILGAAAFFGGCFVSLLTTL